MNDEINYKNNPLHGVGLKNLLSEIVDYYGFEILFAYLNINCFKTNPSIESSVKFLKKTDWARGKVEAFYLYQYKNLPKASSSQFDLPPRDRIIPQEQTPGEPAKLSLEDAEKLREKRAEKASEWNRDKKHRSDKRSGTHDNKRPVSSARRGPWQTQPEPQGSQESSPNRLGKSKTGNKIDPWAKSRNK